MTHRRRLDLNSKFPFGPNQKHNCLKVFFSSLTVPISIFYKQLLLIKYECGHIKIIIGICLLKNHIFTIYPDTFEQHYPGIAYSSYPEGKIKNYQGDFYVNKDRGIGVLTGES